MDADQLNAATEEFINTRRGLMMCEQDAAASKRALDELKLSEATITGIVAADANYKNEASRKAEIAKRVAAIPGRQATLEAAAYAEDMLIKAKANVSIARERLATARLIFAAVHGVSGIVSGGE